MVLLHPPAAYRGCDMMSRESGRLNWVSVLLGPGGQGIHLQELYGASCANTRSREGLCGALVHQQWALLGAFRGQQQQLR